MTSRITTAFANAKSEGRGILGVFVTAGDPDRQTSEAILDALVDCGWILSSLACPSPTRWRMAQRFRRHRSAL